MDKTFDLLEDRVRKAADLVTRLRKENKGFQDDLTKARHRLQEAEKRLESLETSQSSESLEKDLASLRKEREEVRVRIAKLVEILEGLD